MGIVKVDKLDPEVYLRLMQANFDSALDARYAVVRGVLWSAFLHPLGSLNDSQFLKGVGTNGQSSPHLRCFLFIGFDEFRWW